MIALLKLSLSHLIATNSIYPYHDWKNFKCFRVKNFNKSVCNDIFYRYIGNRNLFGLEFLLNLILLYLNIFCMLMNF